MSEILSDAEIDALGLFGPTGEDRHIQMDDAAFAKLKAHARAANAAISRQQGTIDGQALRIEDYEKRLSPIKTEG